VAPPSMFPQQSPSGVAGNFGKDTIFTWKDNPSPPFKVPSGQTTSPLSNQPTDWPKIVQIQGYPLTVFVVASTRWSPGTGTVSCWTYISSGLHAVDQPEMVLTVNQRANENVENWPQMPLEWARILYDAAAKDRVHVDAGQMVELFFQTPFKAKIGNNVYTSDLKFWHDWQRLGMLVHVECHGDYADLPPLPYPRHHVIALTHNEAAVAQEFGCHRVISRMVLQSSWFPIPGWIDRDRADVTRMAENAGSIHVRTQQLKRARIYGLSAILAENGDLILRLPENPERRAEFQALVARVAVSDGMVLESFLPSDADAMLSWKTGNKTPQVLRRSAEQKRCLSLAFLSFGQQPNRNEWLIVEDGVGLILTRQAWSSVLDAMNRGFNLDMPVISGWNQTLGRFCLRWRREGVIEPEQLQWKNAATAS